MIDQFTILHRGGALLWERQLTAIEDEPINILIKSVLLEERNALNLYHHNRYTIKWAFSNEYDLVFIAIYLSMSNIFYVEDLFQQVKASFISLFKENITECKPMQFYSQFDKRYDHILWKIEGTQSIQRMVRNTAINNALTTTILTSVETPSKDTDDDEEGKQAVENHQPSSLDNFDNNKLQRLQMMAANRVGGGRAMRPPGPRRKSGNANATATPESNKTSTTPSKRVKAPTKWDDRVSRDDASALDFSDKSSVPANGVAYNAMGDPDKAIEANFSDDEDDDADQADGDNIEDTNASSQSTGLFGFLKGFVVGKKLTESDLEPVLAKFKQSLMAKNVAHEIAEELCKSVEATLIGETVGSFTTIKSTVRSSIETALTRILTPGQQTDILHGVLTAKEQNRPYTVVFLGVNGVGKSTSLAKTCAYFKSKGYNVGIAACDTFRAGAIEQLRTHATALNVPLYDKGYDRDAANVAQEAIARAKRDGIDVLLIDTAGRMQDNEPLMRQLSKLIQINKPDLILFVGEALVGNDAVDQASKFNRCLSDLSTDAIPRLIDGIILTKFDTIDDKVGAAISMAYTTGRPIMFVGTGQRYSDLKRMNAKTLVKALLK